MHNKKYLSELVLTGLFSAIIIIMAFTPLGYIPLGIINATIIQIPVIIGSLFCGPKKGAFLGFLFGFTSFLKNTIMPASLSAFVFSPILAASQIGTIGILYSTFICFVPRILVGVLPYFIYIGLRKLIKVKAVNFGIAGVLGAFVNTALVMGSIFILYKDAYAQALNVDPNAVAGVIGGIVSFNGVIEAILSGFIVSAVGVVLNKIKPIK
ncbi:MAG: ECF transporter S component [Lachnospiraceae bacterium]|nr:ECF transporter S component [Lachnospiraceae bacterium]